MNNILKTSLIVVVTLILAGGLFFAGSMFGSFAFQRNMPMMQNGVRNQGIPNDQNQVNPPNGQNDRGGQRQGNMPGNGGGRMGQGQGDGPDMRMPGGDMGRGPGRGMGNDGMGGPGMGMNGPGNNPANLTPVTADEAKKAAQDYITSIKVSGLEVGEVLIVNSHAYVAVKETATGNGAFELMVDPLNKIAHPAMGPASAWNLKYGGVLQTNMLPNRRGPMMGQTVTATPAANATAAPLATPADVSAEMPLTEADAIKAAQTYLDAHYAGATAATSALKFYGYYSIDFSKDGNVIGKLSVNGYNGQVAGRAWQMDGRP